MPAKATLTKKEAENPADFSNLTLAERVSLRKFSLAFIALQAVPAALAAVFVIIAGTKYGYFSLQTGLLGLLGLLGAYYFMMPGMSQKVVDGIMALRSARAAKNVLKTGV